MIPSTETLSQVAQLEAAREAEAADANVVRLDIWRRKYPYDVVEVPEAKEVAVWPSRRVEAAPPLTGGKATVTKITARAAR